MKYIFNYAALRRRLKCLCCVRLRTLRISCSRLAPAAKAAMALSDRQGKENNDEPQIESKKGLRSAKPPSICARQMGGGS